MEMRQVLTEPAKNGDSSTPAGEIVVVVTDERPEAELKVAAATSGGAMVDLASGSEDARKAAAEEEEPVPPALAGLNAAGGAVKKKTKTKLVPVSAEYIKEHYMIPAESFEEQAMLDGFDAIAERLRARHDEETAILEQYRKYGYAYEELEVDDDDEAPGLDPGKSASS